MTVTGPRGVGKTRMAVEVGARPRPRSADAVWMVDLAPVGSEEVVAETARVFDGRAKLLASVARQALGPAKIEVFEPSGLARNLGVFRTTAPVVVFVEGRSRRP